VSASVNVTVHMAGARLGGAVFTLKLTPEQLERERLLVWIDGDAVIVPLHEMRTKGATRGAQHARKESGR
jgi:hypothetical protein